MVFILEVCHMLFLLQVYIRDCTMVSVYPLLLFGSGVISIDLERGDFILSIDDGWIRFLVKSHEVRYYNHCEYFQVFV